MAVYRRMDHTTMDLSGYLKGFICILLGSLAMLFSAMPAWSQCVSTQAGALLTAATYGGDTTCTTPGSGVSYTLNHTVTWDGTGGPVQSSVTIASGGTLQITGAGGTISGNLILNGGTFDVDNAITVSGALTHTASSTIDLAATLTYSGAAVNIGSFDLTINGTGTFSNTNAINLNSADSILAINGNSTLSAVAASSTSNATKGLDINAATTISSLTFGGAANVDIVGGQTLYASNAITVGSGITITLTNSGAFNPTAGLVMNGGTLANSSDSSLGGNLTVTGSSTFSLANTLNYAGSAINLGANTLTVNGSGNGNFHNSANAISLDNANSLLQISGGARINNVSVDATSSSGRGITTTGSGTLTTLTLNESTEINVGGSQVLGVTNAATVASGKTLTLTNTGTLAVDGGLALNGGTLANSASTTLQGNLTLSASSTISLSGTLTYTGDAISIGARTLVISGSSNFSNTNAIQLDNGSSILQVTGTGTINNVAITADSTGSNGLDINETSTITTLTLTQSTNLSVASSKTLTVTNSSTIGTGESLTLNETGTLTMSGGLVLNGGTLTVSAAGTLGGALSVTADSSINLTAALTYSGSAPTIGGNTLQLLGGGTFSNTNAFQLNDADSLLQLDGGTNVSAATVTVQSNASKGFDINGASTLGTLTLSASSRLDIASGITFTVSNTISLGSSIDLSLNNTGTLSASITLNGGSFTTAQSMTLSGNLTVSASSSIFPTNTLTYSGAAIDIGGNTLTVSGSGTFSNTNALQLNDANSLLLLSGGPTISSVSATTTSNTGKGITVDTNTTITTLTITGQPFVDIASGVTLTVTNAITLPTNSKLTLSGLGNFTPSGGVTLNGGTFGNTGAGTVLGNLTVGASSSIESAATLAYSGSSIDLGAFTVTISGTGTFNNAQNNAFTLSNADSLLAITGATSVSSVVISAAANSGKGLDIDGSPTISTLTMSQSSAFDVAANQTLFVTNSFQVANSNTLSLSNSGTLHTAGGLLLAGGVISNSAAATIAGSMAIDADSIISMSSGFTYAGTNLAINAYTLSINGGQSLTTAAPVTLNKTSSLLVINDNASVTSAQILEDSETSKGLVVNGTSTIDTLSLNASTNMDIASGQTLTVNSAMTVPTSKTLTFTDSGTFTPSNGVTLAGATLVNETAMTYSGSLSLSETASSTITSSGTLTYSGAAIALGARTLLINGTSNFINSGAIQLDDGDSELQVTGAVTINSVNFTTASNVGQGLNIDSSPTITSLSMSASLWLDVAASQTLFLTNSVSIPSSTTFSWSSTGNLHASGGIVLAGGLFNSAGSKTLNGTLSLTTSSSMAVSDTLTYNGGTIELGANQLSVSGTSGIFVNENSISLNNADSILNLTSDNTISNVSASATSNSGKGLDIDSSPTFTTLTITGQPEANIASGQTLTVTNAMSLPSNSKLTLTSTGTLNPAAGVTLNGGTLANTAAGTITGDLSVAASSAIQPSATLSYSGNTIALGALTLTMSGGGRFHNAQFNSLNLSNADSLLVVEGATSITTVGIAATSNSGKGLDVNGSATFTSLAVSQSVNLDIASGQTLFVTSTFQVANSQTMNLSNTGRLHADGGLLMNGGAVANSAAATIAGSMSVGGDSYFLMSADFTYGGTSLAVNHYQLHIGGNHTFTADNPINLNHNESLLVTNDSTTVTQVKVTAASDSGKGLDFNGTTTLTSLNVVDSTNIDIATGTTTTVTNATTIPSAKTLNFSNTGTFNGAIALNGGTFQNDQAMTLSGDFTVTESSTINAVNTLTYSGAAVDVGANALGFTGSGNFSNTNALQLNNSSSYLALAGASTINSVSISTATPTIDARSTPTITTLTTTESLTLNIDASQTLFLTNGLSLPEAKELTLTGTGTLDTVAGLTMNSGSDLRNNGNRTLRGNITINSSGTIDTGSSTLNYEGSAISLGAGTLWVSSFGTFNNTNAIQLDNSTSLLNLSNTVTVNSVSVSAASSSDVRGINVTGSVTINTLAMTESFNLDINSASSLTLTNATTIPSGKTLALLGTGTLAGALTMNGGILSNTSPHTISGNLTMSAASTFNLASDLTYTGAAVSLGANQLTLAGTGTVSNTNALTLDNASSKIQVDATVTVNAITVSAAASSGGLDVNENMTITTLSSSNSFPLDVAEGRILTVSNSATHSSGTVTYTGLGNLTFDNGLSLNTGSLAVNGGGTLRVTGTTTLNGTLSGSSGTLVLNTVSGNGTLNASGLTANLNGTVDSNITLTTDASSSVALLSNSQLTLGADQLGGFSLGGGTLVMGGNHTISGTIAHTASSVVNLNGNTLTYSGGAFNVATTLTVSGTGTFSNVSNAVQLNDSASRLLVDGNSTISAVTISSTGSTVDIDASPTISTLTMSESTTLDVGGGETLTVTDAWSIPSGKTLYLSSPGTLTNTGGVTISGGVLSSNAPFSLNGNFLVAGDSSIRAAGTITYGGAAVALGANTLTIAGTGAWSSGNGFTLDNADSLLSVNNSSTIGLVTISADANSNKGLDIDTSMTITTLTTTQSTRVEMDQSTSVTVTNAISVGSGESLDLNGPASGSATFTPSGGITFSGATLSNGSGTVNVAGNITLSNSSTLSINGIVNYTGAGQNLGAQTLTATGSGTFNNTNNLVLDDADSEIQFDGAITIAAVSQTATNNSGKGLDVNASGAISQFTVAVANTIDVAASATFTISNTTTTISAGQTWTLSGSGTMTWGGAMTVEGTLDNAITTTVSGNFTINGTLNNTGKFTVSGNTSGSGTINSLSSTFVAGGTLDTTSLTFNTNSDSALEVAGGTTTINGDVDFPIALTGGTVSIDGERTISAAITVTASSTLQMNNTLTFTGSSFAVNSGTLTITGSGTLVNTQPIVVAGSATLHIASSISVSNVTLNGDNTILDIDASTTISTITNTGSTTWDVLSGQVLTVSSPVDVPSGSTMVLSSNGTVTFSGGLNLSGGLTTSSDASIGGAVVLAGNSTMTLGGVLTYTGTSISLGTSTLVITGGTFNNSNALLLNNAASTLQLSGVTINLVQVSVDSATTSGLDIDGATVITTLNLGASTTLDIADAIILTVTNAMTVPSTETLTLNSTGTLTATGGLVLNGGTLAATGAATLAGDLSLTDSSTLALTSNLNYTGSSVSVGARTLAFTGTGTFNATNPVLMDNNDSLVTLAGNTLTGLTGTATSNTNKGLTTSASSTITTLTNTGNLNVDIANNTTLTLTNAVTLPASSTLNLSNTGTLQPSGGIALNGGTLKNDQATTVSGNLSIQANSTLNLGANLTYSGSAIALGTSTLEIQGTGSLLSGTVTLDNADSNLSITTSGTINQVNINVDNNASKGLTINNSTTIGTLNLSGTARLNYSTASTLSITNALTVPTNESLLFAGIGGVLQTNGDLTVTGTVTMGSCTIDIQDDLILTGSMSVGTGRVIMAKNPTNSTGTLDVSAGTLELKDNLTVSGWNLTNNTISRLILGASPTFTASSAHAVGTLDLEGNTLTLAIPNDTFTITQPLTVTGNSAIVTQTTEVIAQGAVTMTGGTLRATSGIFNLDAGGTFSGGQLDFDDGTLKLGGTMTLSGATIASSNSLVELTRTSSLNGNTSTEMSVSSLKLKGNTLNVADIQVVVVDPFAMSSANDRLITAQSAVVSMSDTFTLFKGEVQANGSRLALNKGGQVVSGTLEVGSQLALGGDLSAQLGSVSMANATLQLVADASLNTSEAVQIAGLDLNNHQLTLKSATSDLIVSGAVTMNGAASILDTGDADVTFNNNVSLTDAQLLSTGGSIQVAQSLSLFNNASLTLTGGSLLVGSMFLSDSSNVTLTNAAIGSLQPTGTSTISITGNADLELNNAVAGENLQFTDKVPLATNTVGLSDGIPNLASVLVSPSQIITQNDGSQNFVTLQLNQAPTADVVLGLVISDPTQVSTTPETLTFTPTDWNVPQVVTVTGLDDNIPDGDRPFTLTISTTQSNDTNFSVMNAVVLQGTNEAINLPPVAATGANQQVFGGLRVLLDGSASSDVDGRIVNYSWQQLCDVGQAVEDESEANSCAPLTDQCTNAVTLSNAQSAQPLFTAPTLTTSEETLLFRLTVEDDGGRCDHARTTVSVVRSQTVTLGSASVVVPETASVSGGIVTQTALNTEDQSLTTLTTTQVGSSIQHTVDNSNQTNDTVLNAPSNATVSQQPDGSSTLSYTSTAEVLMFVEPDGDVTQLVTYDDNQQVQIDLPVGATITGNGSTLEATYTPQVEGADVATIITSIPQTTGQATTVSLENTSGTEISRLEVPSGAVVRVAPSGQLTSTLSTIGTDEIVKNFTSVVAVTGEATHTARLANTSNTVLSTTQVTLPLGNTGTLTSDSSGPALSLSYASTGTNARTFGYAIDSDAGLSTTVQGGGGNSVIQLPAGASATVNSIGVMQLETSEIQTPGGASVQVNVSANTEGELETQMGFIPTGEVQSDVLLFPTTEAGTQVSMQVSEIETSQLLLSNINLSLTPGRISPFRRVALNGTAAPVFSNSGVFLGTDTTSAEPVFLVSPSANSITQIQRDFTQTETVMTVSSGSQVSVGNSGSQVVTGQTVAVNNVATQTSLHQGLNLVGLASFTTLRRTDLDTRLSKSQTVCVWDGSQFQTFTPGEDVTEGDAVVIQPGEGFYVDSSEADTLVLPQTGSYDMLDILTQLQTGWNLLGASANLKTKDLADRINFNNSKTNSNFDFSMRQPPAGINGSESIQHTAQWETASSKNWIAGLPMVLGVGMLFAFLSFLPGSARVRRTWEWLLVGGVLIGLLMSCAPEVETVSGTRAPAFNSQVHSIWKLTELGWVAYSPDNATQQRLLEAGYPMFNSLEPGDGFWVNIVDTIDPTAAIEEPPSCFASSETETESAT